MRSPSQLDLAFVLALVVGVLVLVEHAVRVREIEQVAGGHEEGGEVRRDVQQQRRLCPEGAPAPCRHERANAEAPYTSAGVASAAERMATAAARAATAAAVAAATRTPTAAGTATATTAATATRAAASVRDRQPMWSTLVRNGGSGWPATPAMASARWCATGSAWSGCGRCRGGAAGARRGAEWFCCGWAAAWAVVRVRGWPWGKRPAWGARWPGPWPWLWPRGGRLATLAAVGAAAVAGRRRRWCRAECQGRHAALRQISPPWPLPLPWLALLSRMRCIIYSARARLGGRLHHLAARRAALAPPHMVLAAHGDGLGAARLPSGPKPSMTCTGIVLLAKRSISCMKPSSSRGTRGSRPHRRTGAAGAADAVHVVFAARSSSS